MPEVDGRKLARAKTDKITAAIDKMLESWDANVFVRDGTCPVCVAGKHMDCPSVDGDGELCLCVCWDDGEVNIT